MFIDPNEDVTEPARIGIGARTPADLAFILFHEGFRVGYNVVQDGIRPPNMENYIREMFKMVVKEIREQTPTVPRPRS